MADDASASTAAERASRAVRAAAWLWGGLLAAWICRDFFGRAPGELPINHEGYSYVQRIVEFRELLRAGYLFPQWAPDFRGGLGSPYFGYYQPGFFYVAGAVASVLPLPAALAVTLTLLALLGYAGLLELVRPRFGVAGGILAGTAFLLSPYVHDELYVRGDFSEFAGMMIVPPALYALVAWLEHGRSAAWWLLAAAACGLVVTHPVAGLFGYGALVVVTACWLARGAEPARIRGALTALAAGVGLAGFYLVPILLEWRFVEGEQLHVITPDQPPQFVLLGELLAPRTTESRWTTPVALGLPLMALSALAIAVSVARWRRLDTSGRRLLVALGVLAIGTIWLMHPTSLPLWNALPLLRFAQFPWRALLVLTPVLAAIAGSLSVGRAVVGWALAAAGIALCLWSGGGARARVIGHYPPATTARALADEYVAPDAANEWMPRGAFPIRLDVAPRAPACTGGCTLAGFTRDTVGLRVRVESAGPTDVVLPHFWFPVGWTATLDGAPVSLERTPLGLMRLSLATSGMLDVRFGATPGRRLGIAVSALVLAMMTFATRRRR